MTTRQEITALATIGVCLAAQVEADAVSSRPEVVAAIADLGASIARLGKVAGSTIYKRDIDKAAKAFNTAVKVLR